jgi:hypothetical protein
MLRSCSLAVIGNDRHSARRVKRFITSTRWVRRQENVPPIASKHARVTNHVLATTSSSARAINTLLHSISLHALSDQTPI